MSLLDIIIDVADECGYAVDSVVIGSQNTTTRQLRAMAQRVVEELADKFPWPALSKTATITLTASQASYELPGDFSYYHYDTFWNQSSEWALSGPMTEIEYAEYLGSDTPSETASNFIIQGVTNETLTFFPPPGADEAGEIIVFRYLAARPIRPQTWVQGLSISIGNYCFYDGNYYVATTAGLTGSTPPTHTSSTGSDGGVTWEYYDGPYKIFLADTDEVVLSERIVKQGVMERFAEPHGLSVVPRFEMQAIEEYGKVRPGRTIDATGRGFSGRRAWARNGRVRFGG